MKKLKNNIISLEVIVVNVKFNLYEEQAKMLKHWTL